MANEAATEWVSPHYTSLGGWDSYGVIWVLNTNSDLANVTVTFFEQTGPEADKQQTVISSNESRPFHIDQKFSGDFWVHLKSDKPVFPWGHTPASLYLGDHHVHMSFYPAEGIKLQEIVRVPVGALKRKPRPRPA